MPNVTVVEYMYRDAGNYKYYGHCYIAGILTAAEIEPYLINGEYFVPERIGLKGLVPEQMNSDDHLLHEILSVGYSCAEQCNFDKAEFVQKMKIAHETGWFERGR